MIAAFFDMDETLIHVNSGRLWIKKLWEDGQLSKRDLVKSMAYLLGYRFAAIDMNRVAGLAVSRLEGMSEADMKEDIFAWFETEIRPHVISEMAAKVEEHRQEAHLLVLLTASSPYVAAPLAEHMGIEHFLCSRFGVDASGCFTGKLEGAFCYGEGKVQHSESFAREHAIDLSQSYFYTDSYTDLPMLERVGHPIAVNADPRLKRYAKRRGLPSLVFKSRA